MNATELGADEAFLVNDSPVFSFDDPATLAKAIVGEVTPMRAFHNGNQSVLGVPLKQPPLAIVLHVPVEIVAWRSRWPRFRWS